MVAKIVLNLTNLAATPLLNLDTFPFTSFALHGMAESSPLSKQNELPTPALRSITGDEFS